jgi:anti-anti-sigma regulatory factor
LLILRVDAPLYSANVRAVHRLILEAVDALDPKPTVVLVDVTAVATITTTILGVMQETLEQLDERGVKMWIAAFPERALRIARKLPHWADWADSVFPTVAEGVAAYRDRKAGPGSV